MHDMTCMFLDNNNTNTLALGACGYAITCNPVTYASLISRLAYIIDNCLFQGVQKGQLPSTHTSGISMYKALVESEQAKASMRATQIVAPTPLATDDDHYVQFVYRTCCR